MNPSLSREQIFLVITDIFHYNETTACIFQNGNHRRNTEDFSGGTYLRNLLIDDEESGELNETVLHGLVRQIKRQQLYAYSGAYRAMSGALAQSLEEIVVEPNLAPLDFASLISWYADLMERKPKARPALWLGAKEHDLFETIKDERVSGEKLMTLATHPSRLVRDAVVANRNCPEDALIIIALINGASNLD